ncbi:hypothetical protein BDZ45DRAFT_744105 [Acephala macrosclerotiorum]|nr:hypothetical protein BDZ45DRAFT_744105 [Acephala macrosclerotiorum]
MELFKRPLLHLKSKPQPAAQPAPAARLDQLPTEILLEIISYLPILSKITMSLSCKRLGHLIGSQPIDSHIYRTLDLLQLLVRDLPESVICPYCLKLHKVKVEVKARRKSTFSRTRIMGERRVVVCWRGGVKRRFNLRDMRYSGPGLRRIV